MCLYIRHQTAVLTCNGKGMANPFDSHDSAFRKLIAVHDEAVKEAWFRLAGGVPRSTVERNHFLREFIDPIHSERGAQLSLYLGMWQHYQFAMYETALEYEQGRQRTIRTGIEIRELAVGGAEVKYSPSKLAEAIRDTTRCRIALECFYFQTKLLLERVARTFAFYFGMQIQGEGSAHALLTMNFKKYWAQLTGARAPRELLKAMKELDRQVIKFRNIHIEHVSEPEHGLQLGVEYEDGGDAGRARIYVGNRRSTSPGFWQPRDVIQRTEDYLSLSLLFFMANVDVSVLGADEPPANVKSLWPASQGTREPEAIRLPPRAKERAARRWTERLV